MVINDILKSKIRHYTAKWPSLKLSVLLDDSHEWPCSLLLTVTIDESVPFGSVGVLLSVLHLI